MGGTSPLGWLYLGEWASTGTVPVITPVIPTGFGPGNGGELFSVQLNSVGTTTTVTLTSALTSTGTLLHISGDSGLPATGGLVLTIDSEVVYVTKISSGLWRIRGRGFSNTTAAAHANGTSATWTDTYDQAINATENINASFTANIASTGSTTYYGFLMPFDSTQARIGSSRYPFHVTSFPGVFPVGTGTSGTNRMDASQSNKICTTAALSDDCPAALGNPSRINTSILPTDVAICRYTNPEAAILNLTSRSTALQAWYGLERVDTSNNDVTVTDPTGTVIDGTINTEQYLPAAGYVSVVLPASSRSYTRVPPTSPPYWNDKGLPIGCLTVRQDNHRVPYWHSPTWHNFNYVYSGFGTDATFAHLIVNRNAVASSTSDPSVNLPGDQDIDGPKVTWDDNRYYFGVSWYVAIYNTPLLVFGPTIGGTIDLAVQLGDASGLPTVTFPGPPGAGVPTVTVPPTVEDGSGGNISPPGAYRSRFWATLT